MRITVVFTLFFFLLIAGESMGKPVGQDSMDAGQWIGQHFIKGKLPPFSFVYGGKSSTQFLKNWKFSSEKVKSKNTSADEWIYTYSDPRGSLTVQCFVTIFNDFPAVEWVLKFSNPSGKNTPIIEKVNVVDYSFPAEKEGDFMLYHARGSDASRSDFQPIDEKMEPGKNIYLTPAGGRSSDRTAFPFFNIEMPGGQGMVVAVGWTGKWFSDIVQDGPKSVTLKSGMERMQLNLLPKEEIRTPKICLLFWKGDDRMVGHN
ncbi:MAG: alpha-galactosidase, partial [Bacteroidia bacterium]|nr:alpha-galactosidase [Bacteroidia bacterium]